MKKIKICRGIAFLLVIVLNISCAGPAVLVGIELAQWAYLGSTFFMGGKVKIDDDKKPAQIMMVSTSSRTPIAIGTETKTSIANYTYVAKQEYVGPGTVLELFAETEIEDQTYYITRATYYNGKTNIIEGIISKAEVQQLLITKNLQVIQLKDGCPAECLAKNNAPE